MTSDKPKKLKIFTGSGRFEELITESDLYVDKSLFIQEIIVVIQN